MGPQPPQPPSPAPVGRAVAACVATLVSVLGPNSPALPNPLHSKTTRTTVSAPTFDRGTTPHPAAVHHGLWPPGRSTTRSSVRSLLPLRCGQQGHRADALPPRRGIVFSLCHIRGPGVGPTYPIVLAGRHLVQLGRTASAGRGSQKGPSVPRHLQGKQRPSATAAHVARSPN